MSTKMWAIVYGNLFEGIQGVEGPFDSEAKAHSYAELHNLGHYEKCVYELELHHELQDEDEDE